MKKLVIITIISVFLIFSSSIINAQGNFRFWQLPNFYGQYNQPWGFQSFMPNYFGQYNYTPQSWSYPQRFSSGSSSQLWLYSETIFSQNGQYYKTYEYI